MKLSDKLTAIANNKTFDSEALYSALKHKVTTKNDVLMLLRYMDGKQYNVDHIRLHELANYIKESEDRCFNAFGYSGILKRVERVKAIRQDYMEKHFAGYFKMEG